MENEVKVTEAPAPETVEQVKAPVDVVIDNPRARVEAQLAKNAEAEKTEVAQPEKVEVPEVVSEEVVEDPIERIKKATQKRIDKVVAQKKSAEEELVEARAEIERLRLQSKNEVKEVPKEQVKDDAPPTPEQVEAYIALKQEEGNWKEAAAAMRYLVKLEKEMALKEIEEKNNKSVNVAEQERQQQLREWTDLAKDYEVQDDSGKVNPKDEMNLNNKDGLLFKLATDYYNDKSKHAERYNNPNIMQGFRRAVADAYRDINEHYRRTPREEKVEVPKRNSRAMLADPSADYEDSSSNTQPSSLSDAEKVRAEINARNKRR